MAASSLLSNTRHSENSEAAEFLGGFAAPHHAQKQNLRVMGTPLNKPCHSKTIQ
jgi:hypothetical protein